VGEQGVDRPRSMISRYRPSASPISHGFLNLAKASEENKLEGSTAKGAVRVRKGRRHRHRCLTNLFSGRIVNETLEMESR